MIALGLPPSTNHTYRFAGRYMYKTREARDWEEEMGWSVKRWWRKAPLTKDVAVSITYFLKFKRDVDGSHKIILDLLQKHKIYINDSQITELSLKKLWDKQNPRAEVEVAEL